MYQYTVVDVEYNEQTFTFNTYEKLLAHYNTYFKPYTQGCDPYYRVVGWISRNACLVR